MKLRFEPLYRGLIVLLVLIAGWSLWAAVTGPTNSPSPEPLRAEAPLLKTLDQFQSGYLTFGLDRIPLLRDHTFLGEPLWKYVASLFYILLAFYVSKLIDFVAGVWLKRLAARTETKVDDLLLGMLHGPVKVVALVVLLHIGLNIFDWSPRAQVYLSRGLIVIVASSLTYLAVKVLNLLLDLWKRRVATDDRKFNEQMFSFLRKSLNAFIVVVAVLVTAQNMGINMTAAITSLSIGGLAVGLAAQDTLANLFGAVAVLTDKPFRVGDNIKLDTAEGVVETVGLRSTRLRSPDGHLVTVPNKTMGSATITNVSERPNIKTVMNVTLARTLPAARVKHAIALLDEAYRQHPMTQDVWINFNRFVGANTNIQIIHWAKGTNYRAYLDAMGEMNLEVKQKFEAEGIHFA